MYLRLTRAALMLPKCSGCFLLVLEECMLPGAASREQQQQQRACASTARQQSVSRWDASSDRIRRRTPLRWTPDSAGWRSPHVCTEMRLSMCRMCRGSIALAVAIRLYKHVRRMLDVEFCAEWRALGHVYLMSL